MLTITRTTPLSSLLSSMTWNPINHQFKETPCVPLSFGQDFIVNPAQGQGHQGAQAQGFDLMGGGCSISADAVFATAEFDGHH